MKHIPRYRCCKDRIINDATAALAKLSRSLKLRAYYTKYPSPLPPQLYPRIPTTWTPDASKPGTGIPLIDNWHTSVLAKLQNHAMSLSNKISAYDANLLKALQSLKELPVVIKPADKNLGTALLSPAHYHKLCMGHLADENTYKKQAKTPLTHTLIINRSFAQLKAILTKFEVMYGKKRKRDGTLEVSKLAQSLLQLQPPVKVVYPEGVAPPPQPPSTDTAARISSFYILPKLHKKTISGRPIVNTINSPTYMTSLYLHKVLLEVQPHLPSIVMSTHDALRKLHSAKIPPNAVLLCADVMSLYPSIPIPYGLRAVKSTLTTLKQRGLISQDINIDLTLALLEWTLRNNYLSYLDDYYLQLTGTAMGTPVAVMYANIVLADLEHCALNELPYLYMRYIDDLCVICKDEEQAEDIIYYFEQACPSIQLDDITIGPKGVFLDLAIELHNTPDSTEIRIQTYQKSINKYMYITPSSAHQRTVLKNFIYNELCRYKLHCSDEVQLRTMYRAFNERIIRRGYNPNYIIHILSSLPSRKQLLDRLFKPKASKKKDLTVCTLPLAIKDFIHQPNKFFEPSPEMKLHPVLSSICKPGSLLFNYSNDPSMLSHLCNDSRTKLKVQANLQPPTPQDPDPNP